MFKKATRTAAVIDVESSKPRHPERTESTYVRRVFPNTAADALLEFGFNKAHRVLLPSQSKIGLALLLLLVVLLLLLLLLPR